MKKAFIIAILLLLPSCGPLEEEGIYTLYRASVLDENMRIHVATFNAKAGNDYNQGNCRIAEDLFQSQPRVIVKYWCEKGSYRK